MCENCVFIFFFGLITDSSLLTKIALMCKLIIEQSILSVVIFISRSFERSIRMCLYRTTRTLLKLFCRTDWIFIESVSRQNTAGTSPCFGRGKKAGVGPASRIYFYVNLFYKSKTLFDIWGVICTRQILSAETLRSADMQVNVLFWPVIYVSVVVVLIRRMRPIFFPISVRSVLRGIMRFVFESDRSRSVPSNFQFRRHFRRP